MTEKPSEVTTGAAALFPTLPTVEVNGQTLTMKRLGLSDALLGLKIFSSASAGVLRHAQSGDGNLNIGLALIAALPYAEVHVVQMLAIVLDTSTHDLRIPDTFPQPVFNDNVHALGQHPDLSTFSDILVKIIEQKAY